MPPLASSGLRCSGPHLGQIDSRQSRPSGKDVHRPEANGGLNGITQCRFFLFALEVPVKVSLAFEIHLALW
jgi:hypothetical protein